MRSDTHAAAQPIAVALMTGVTVAILLGGVSLADAVQDQAEALQSVRPPAVQTRADAGAHEVSLMEGSLKVDKATITATIGGTQHKIPLQWYAERGLLGKNLDTGTWLCVSGPRSDCPLPSNHTVTISLDSGTHNVHLGELKLNDDEGSTDSVRISGERASHYIDLQGGVVLQEAKEVFMQVIGTQITWGAGGPNVPVQVRPTIDGGINWLTVFPGPVERGHIYNLGTLESWSRLGIKANADYSWFHAEYDSLSGDPHVITLRHGDPVPSAPAFSGQVPVTALLAPYAADGTIVLDDNEIIILVEFNSNLSSTAADFQDLIVHFTFDPVPLQGVGDAYVQPSTPAQTLCKTTVNGPVTVIEWWDDAGDELLLGSIAGPCTHEELNPKDDSPEDTLVCHLPPGNPDNKHDLMVSQFALAAHLHHGDTLGSCE